MLHWPLNRANCLPAAHMSLIEIAGVLTGIVAVWLTTRENVWCWPIGIVSVLLFVDVFYRAHLYGAMGLQVVYAGLAAYGWYAWTRGGQDEGPLRVSRSSTRTLAVSALVGIAFTAALALGLRHGTDEALPFTDAATTAFSLVAQWMQTRKLIENWWVWLVVDVVYVGMNLSQALFWTAGLYAVYCALAVAGLVEWRRGAAS
jgi:nicotinamide mononucleotide transporter